MVVIGIDPGLTGGIAFLGPRKAVVRDLPTQAMTGAVTRRIDARALYAMLLEHCQDDKAVVVIEELATGGRNQDGSSRANAMTAGSQFRTRGAIETVCELVGLTVYPVEVKRWKKLFGLPGKSDPTAVDRALATAKAFYPGLEGDLARKKDHNRAEAILLAHWGHKVRPWVVF